MAAVQAAAVDVLHEEGLLPHDTARADAQGDVPRLPPHLPEQIPLPGVPMAQVNRVTKRVQQRVAKILRARPWWPRCSTSRSSRRGTRARSGSGW